MGRGSTSLEARTDMIEKQVGGAQIFTMPRSQLRKGGPLDSREFFQTLTIDEGEN